MKVVKVVTIIFFSFIFSFNLSAASLGQIADAYQSKVSKFSLENGMRFLIVEDDSAEVVTFHVQVRAGSVYERPRETGMNHLIEHLAFAGTDRIGAKNWEKEKVLLRQLDKLHLKIIEAKANSASQKKIQGLKKKFNRVRQEAAGLANSNQFSAILDREGAVGPNAFVSRDFTVYWVELPSTKVELWACLESERLFNSVFRLFYEEIEIVKQERKRVVDNSPLGRLSEEFRSIAYKAHPYRHPIIGYAEDIATMSRSRVKDLYKKYYVPSNILVSIVGDVSTSEIKPLLNKYFGAIPAKEAPSFELAREPKRSAKKRVYVEMDSQPLLLIGFNIPSANHPDIPALKVASEIIGGGRTSRLYRRLVQKEQVAVAANSWVWSPRYPGLFYILAVSGKGHTNKNIEALIDFELRNILDNPPSQRELESAQARLKVDFVKSLKSRRKLASELAWFEDVSGSWKGFFRHQESIGQVEIEDVLEVVERYLRPDKKTVGSLEPAPSK